MKLESTVMDVETNAAQPVQDLTPLQLIQELVERFPRRLAGSRDEFGSQRYLAELLRPHADSVDFIPFRFSANLYLVIAVHFALGLFGTLLAMWSYLAAFAIHLFVAVAYLLDSAHWFYLLRRTLPQCASQNLVAVKSATAPLRRRIVIAGHADAAPTSRLFPSGGAVIAAQGVPGWVTALLKPLRVAVVGMLLLAFTDIWRWTYPDGWSFPGFYIGFNLLNAIIVVATVATAIGPVAPGANDNASGCAAVVAAAQKLSDEKPDDVELVYVITGCEEAGNGGATRLAQQMSDQWDPAVTSVVTIDAIGGGHLVAYLEGEVVPAPPDPEMLKTADQVASGHQNARAQLPRYYPPAGATDEVAFSVFGYGGLTLGAVDPKRGTPTHYHSLTDTPENIDDDVLNEAVEFCIDYCRHLMRPEQV